MSDEEHIYYTVEEARRLLPQIIPHLEALQKQAIQFRKVQEAVRAARDAPLAADGNLTADPWYEEDPDTMEKDSQAFDAAVTAIGRLGIEVKDPERGLIDFYSDRDGVVVFLCYELGEPDIQYWHTLSGGYAGRRPL